MSDPPKRRNQLEKARLVLSVGRVEVSLEDLEAAGPESRLAEGLSRPVLQRPDLEGAFVVPPLQTVALKEVLRHTAFARLSVSLPLLPFEKKIGPFRFALPPGHRALFDLEVKEGFIDRQSTQGRIDPPVDLPFGAKLRGLRLSPDGSVVVDLKNFPDLNLSALSLGNLRVPEALEDLVALWPDEDGELFGEGAPPAPGSPAAPPRPDEAPRPPGGTAAPDDDGAAPAGDRGDDGGDAPDDGDEGGDDAGLADIPIDLARVEIDASGVRPRPERFALGEIGAFTLKHPTVFDVAYSEGHLNAGGRVALSDGHLRGRRFSLAGLAGAGDFRATLEGERLDAGAHFEVGIDQGAFERFAVVLRDGTHLVLGDGAVRDAELAYFKSDDEERLRFTAGQFSGRLLQAHVRAEIGGTPHAITIDEMWVEGSISLGPDHVQVEVAIDGARLSVRDLILPLGLAQVWFSEVNATASGKLVAGTDYGLSFSGALTAEGDMRAGEAALFDVHAHLTEGTRAAVQISELAVSEGGLDVLRAQGELDFRLASGAVPLWEGARLSFSRGAEGRLVVDEVSRNLEDRFPTVRAHGHVVARSDTTALHRRFALPAGEAHIEANDIQLAPDGRLALSDLRMWLETDDG